MLLQPKAGLRASNSRIVGKPYLTGQVRVARHLGVAAMIYKLTSQEQFLRFWIINRMIRRLPEAERGN